MISINVRKLALMVLANVENEGIYSSDIGTYSFYWSGHGLMGYVKAAFFCHGCIIVFVDLVEIHLWDKNGSGSIHNRMGKPGHISVI